MHFPGKQKKRDRQSLQQDSGEKPTPVVYDKQAPDASSEPAPADYEWRSVVPLEYFSVRAAPSPTAAVLLYLTRGKPVSVEISGKPWLKVRHPKLGTKIGYVSGTILDNQPKKE